MGCVELRRENWKYLQFEDVFVDVSKRGKKIPKSDYLSEGRFPIIDQGQKYVAGYSNSSEKLYSDVPALIFGDHTRIIKYVDVPFFLGADGVKLLKSKLSDVDYKFLYYVLSQLHIIDTGYNRHFKYLKEQIIPLPPLDEQKRIAEVLDKASELIKKRKEQIRLMDELAKSLFIEMFGEFLKNNENPMMLSLITKFIDYRGKTPEKSESGIPLITAKNVKNNHFSINPQEFIPAENYNRVMTRGLPKVNDVLFTTEAPLGNVCRIPAIFDRFCVGQRLITMQPKENLITAEYLEYALLSKEFQNELSKKSSGSTVKGIRSKELEKLTLPVSPLPLQNEFADRINAIEQQKALLQDGLAKMETAYKALMQEYFG